MGKLSDPGREEKGLLLPALFLPCLLKRENPRKKCRVENGEYSRRPFAIAQCQSGVSPSPTFRI